MRANTIVNKTKKNLADLLNDESFVRWLNNDAGIEGQKKWDMWQLETPDSQKLIGKAKKMLTMPFKQPEQAPDPAREMNRLKENLSKKTGEESFHSTG